MGCHEVGDTLSKVLIKKTKQQLLKIKKRISATWRGKGNSKENQSRQRKGKKGKHCEESMRNKPIRLPLFL